MMEKFNYDNELYKINYPKGLEELSRETARLLDVKIPEYKDFFCIDKIDKVQVNYFDDLDNFREFIYQLRSENISLPKYACGTYDNGMINAYIDSNNQLEKVYTASHELFHILYMQYILKNDYSKRIVWYDEGMAQFMSGQKNKYLDNEKFKSFYLRVKNCTKTLPKKFNSIDHGDSFCNEQYNGYDLSYLAVRYLFETLNYNDFKSLMSDFSKIKMFGETIIIKMFEYYDNKFMDYFNNDIENKPLKK